MTELKYKRETILKHRRAWIKALRSGEYRRASSYLAKARKKDGVPTSFCCLGLACHIAKVPGILGMGTTTGGSSYIVYGEGRSESFLPKEARDWLGVDESDPGIEWPIEHRMQGTTLADLNDAGWTFVQIADALEKYGIRKMDDLLEVQ